MGVKPGYKQTEVGVIPEDWEVFKLASLTDPSRTTRYGIVQPGTYAVNGILMLRSQDYSKRWADQSTMHRVTTALATQYQNARLRAQDIVMTIVGANTGQIVEIPDWLDGGILSRSTARIAIDKAKANSPFVKFFLLSRPSQLQVIDYLKEGAQPVLSCTDLSKFKIPLPPTKAEQEAIAEALSDADALIESLEQLINKKRQIKQGAMQELLTGKKRLPGFGEEWQTYRQAEIITFINGRAYGKHEWETSGTPVCRLQNLTGSGDTFYYSTLELPEKQYMENGDLIFMWSASFGPYIWQGPRAIFHYHIWKIECDGQLVNRGYYYHKLVELTEYLKSTTDGSTMLHLTKDRMEQFKVTIPDVKEQEAIATVLSDMDAEISALETKLSKARQIKQGMMQELLTGRIRLI